MANQGFKVLDSDMHIVEPWDLWEKWIEPEFKDRAPKCKHDYPTDLVGVEVEGKAIQDWRTEENAEEASRIVAATIETEQQRVERIPALREAIERGFDPTSQIQAMDLEGIDVAVLFPSRGLSVMATDYQDTKLAAAVARAYNNWLAEFCQANPTRMYGAAMVAVHDVEEALRETRRAKEELGFKAIFIRPNPVRGRNWHDSVYDPLWEECQNLGLAVGFHESSSCLLPQAMGERFKNEHTKILILQHVPSHPIEQMYACLSMIVGGALERFPRLRVAFLEGNCSWLPFWLWRMDDHFENRPNRVSGTLPLMPSEYFKRQCFVSIEADEEPGKYVIDWIGDDYMVFSTDYPHPDSKFPYAVEKLLTQPFSQESKRKLLWDSCARLYDL